MLENTNQIVNLIEQQGEAFEVFKNKHLSRVDELAEEVTAIGKQMNDVEKKAGRPHNETGTFSDASPAGNKNEVFFDVKTKKSVPVLNHKQGLSALEQRSRIKTPSIGRLLRGIVLGGQASDASELMDERKSLGIIGDPGGGYTVSGMLSSEWIDNLRAQMVLSRAGCRTVPMETGMLSLAKVVNDPAITWHAENAAIAASDPTFGAVNLNAKTCVCLVKLSLELSQDSANIEQILDTTITNAMAGAIDRAGLVGVTTDTALAPGGVMNLADRNVVSSIGAPTSWDFMIDGMYELMLDNVPEDRIGGFIAHPAVWKKMAKLKTGISSDKTSLVMPQEVATIPKFWTTAAPLTAGTTADGIIADWRDLIFGVRKDINVRVLSESFMGSNLQVAILAYARVDFAATRQQSFCTLEGITV